MPTLFPHSVLILLGSNIDRERNLPQAIRRLAQHAHMDLVQTSSVYETEPVGGQTDQPPFFNAAAAIRTDLSPSALRRALRQIEADMGRVRNGDRYAPRSIDLDIALYDQLTADVDGHPIPDPDIVCHAHVVVPLAEIAPDRIHPETGLTLQQIAAQVAQSGVESNIRRVVHSEVES